MSTFPLQPVRPEAGLSCRRPPPARRGAGLRAACGALLLALLAACGGGGGDGGGGGIAEPLSPPTTGAALASSTTDAAEAAKAAAGAGDRVAERTALMNGLAAALGGPVTASSLPPGDRKQALAVTTEPCSNVLDPPCSGNAVIDTNVADTATRLVPGDYLDATFNDLRGRQGTATVTMAGRMRVEFESTVDLAATTFRGLSAKIRFDAFSASVNGVAFGPVTENGRVQIDSTGVSTVTANGVRYRGLSGVSISSTGNYTVVGGTVRWAHWASSGQYVDVALSNWRVVGARPAVGSQATFGGASGSITARVTASGAGSVVYLVTITSGATSTNYSVTATYPSSGAPTYTAVRS